MRLADRSGRAPKPEAQRRESIDLAKAYALNTKAWLKKLARMFDNSISLKTGYHKNERGAKK
jgi:hypothetical protein